MSTYSWNCRGLGTPWAIQFLKESVLQKQPRFIFLSETLCKSDIVEKVRVVLKYEGALAVDSQGHNGGLALFWRNNSDLRVLSYNKNLIDVMVDIQGWHTYRMTCLYGEPDRTRRRETWDLIRMLNNQVNLPWVFIGDFNNILSQEDKKEGRMYPIWLIQGFQRMLEDCDLNDLELNGYKYTWERGRDTIEMIEVRLDRAVASSSFLYIFTEVKLTNLGISTSDHSPIYLEPIHQSSRNFIKRLKFENAWLREPM
ncbi:uncharacterized protein LOC141660211 [Apium graveolens]|uniref:uncharacterized protein LOC141660211 n=1 Tax=Apium graveolens TaxID=4045 RepID=UPI003D794A34